LYPGSEESSNPTLISPGTPITLDIELVYYDATASVELPSPTYWNVKVTVTRVSTESTVKTIDFGRADDYQGGVKVDGHFCSIAIWQDSWTVPSGLGELYRFSWTVQIKDSSGNDYGTQTKTTYAKTADIEPDGVFKINGKDASQISGIVILNPELTLQFSPVKNTDKITAVRLEVVQGSTSVATVKLAKQTSADYKGSYTLPGYGTYELNGYIDWIEGTPIQKMSIVMSWGEEQGGFFGINQFVGLICIAADVLLAVKV